MLTPFMLDLKGYDNNYVQVSRELSGSLEMISLKKMVPPLLGRIVNRIMFANIRWEIIPAIRDQFMDDFEQDLRVFLKEWGGRC